MRAGGRKRRYYSAVSGESDDDKSVYRRSGRHRRRQYTAVHRASDMVHSRLSVMTQRNETTSSLLRLTAGTVTERTSAVLYICMSVSMSACLSMSMRPVAKIKRANSTNFSLHATRDCESVFRLYRYCVLRVLWTTSRLSIIG